MNWFRRRSWWIYVLIGVPLVMLAFSLLANVVILTGSRRIYDQVATIPVNAVGLLLGAALRREDGSPNWFCEYRIRAACRLYRAGRIRHILVSGDNHSCGYDEPSDIRAALITRGVPPAAITCDFAGFRTLDSVLRARQVFGLHRFTIISQREHDYRAVAIARYAGLDAIAFAAEEVPWQDGLTFRAREYLARTKAFIDLYLVHTQPHFSGPPRPLVIDPP